MKKILFVVLIFVGFTLIIIERKQTEEKVDDVAIKTVEEKNDNNEKRAVFVSYIEYGNYLRGKDSDTQKENLKTMLDNLQDNGFNMILFQVRIFSDAVYESDIFPWSQTVTGVEGKKPDFDILSFTITEAHKRNIELHAWVNPYRVRNTNDISSISEDNPAYNLLQTSDLKVTEKGIFYNPASDKVKKLIVSGIEEIVKNYDVDGIHFDDYFYPDKEIDLIQYLEYQQEGGEKTLDEYRLDQVSDMVKQVYQTIKNIKPDVLFGISPEGNIDNNYSNNYADTRRWASEEGFVDYLMPQIYFGFENQTRPFIDTVTMWNDIITNNKISLIPALAFYKVGLEDKNALSGKDEWINHSDIIKKEILVSRNLSHYQGFSLFRYDHLFNTELYTETTMKEFEHLQSILGI